MPNRRDRRFPLRTDVDSSIRAPGSPRCAVRFIRPAAPSSLPILPCPAVLLEYAGRIRRRDRGFLRLLTDVPALRGTVCCPAAPSSLPTSRFGSPLISLALRIGWLYAERTDNGAERARPESARITAALSTELAAMTSEMRCHVLAALDIYVANEIVRSAVRPLELRTRAA